MKVASPTVLLDEFLQRVAAPYALSPTEELVTALVSNVYIRAMELAH
jgi:hypothetical protein